MGRCILSSGSLTLKLLFMYFFQSRCLPSSHPWIVRSTATAHKWQKQQLADTPPVDDRGRDNRGLGDRGREGARDRGDDRRGGAGGGGGREDGERSAGEGSGCASPPGHASSVGSVGSISSVDSVGSGGCGGSGSSDGSDSIGGAAGLRQEHPLQAGDRVMVELIEGERTNQND